MSEDGKQPTHLLDNPLSKYGFHQNCKTPKHSVEKTLTIELEEKRQKMPEKNMTSFVAASEIKSCERMSYLK